VQFPRIRYFLKNKEKLKISSNAKAVPEIPGFSANAWAIGEIPQLPRHF